MRRRKTSQEPSQPENRRSAPVVRPVEASVTSSTSDGPRPWDVLESETPAQYRAFEIYAALSPFERTISETWRRYLAEKGVRGRELEETQPTMTFRSWSTRHNWKERAIARDKYGAAEAHIEAVQKLSAEYFAQHKVGAWIYATAGATLQNKSEAWWNRLKPKELKDMIELGFKIATSAQEKMVDLSVARYDAQRTVLSFGPGSDEETIVDALSRGDWVAAKKYIERLAIAEEMRASLLPHVDSPLGDHKRERVRSFVSLFINEIGKAATSNGNGSNGSGGGQGGSSTPSTPPDASGGANGTPHGGGSFDVAPEEKEERKVHDPIPNENDPLVDFDVCF